MQFDAPDGKPGGECPGGGVSLGWSLMSRGRHLYIACGVEHGVTHEYRSLFDLTTDRLIGTVDVDDDTGEPPPGAPSWAKSRPEP